MVTTYEPAVPEHVNDDVPLEIVLLRARLVGLREHVIPVRGAIVCDRAMVPEIPSNPFAIIVVEPTAPARAVTLVGLAVKAKS